MIIVSEIEIIRIYKPTINLRKCTGCGDCFTACPINEQLKLKGEEKDFIIIIKNGQAVINNAELCDGCGVCLDACSQDAIHIEIKEEKE